MEALTERAQVRELVKFALLQTQNGRWTQPSAKDIATAALDPETATGAELNAVCGGSFVSPYKCEECETETFAAAMIDGHMEPLFVCRSCLVKAIALIDDTKPGGG